MKVRNVLRSLICLILITSTLSITAWAYEPVEAYLHTNKSTYAKDEVVVYMISISGGARSTTVAPVYTYKFKDSTGFTYTASTTDSGIPINIRYTKTGNYIATVTVTSNQAPNTASSSVSIEVTD